jgi:predicted CopG family antitoxin
MYLVVLLATRTISITDEAYQRLKAKKETKESFTDVINRLTRKRSLMELVGIFSDQEIKILEKSIAKSRKRSRSRIGETVKELNQ